MRKGKKTTFVKNFILKVRDIKAAKTTPLDSGHSIGEAAYLLEERHHQRTFQCHRFKGYTMFKAETGIIDEKGKVIFPNHWPLTPDLK